MKVVITEKPAVAREIAIVLGAKGKKIGYFEGNGYYVTWAYGHLIGLAMPDSYGIDGFSKNQLPILPDPFILCLRNLKLEKKFSGHLSKQKQLMLIDSLFKKSSEIIVATDAGREGELIFRYLYLYLKSTKPFKRLWISSLTEKAIKKGFENLQPGSSFDGLYKAAQARSRADWLVGINASQALTIATNNGVYSLGRVQTPTLALICERFITNQNFVTKKFWELELSISKNFSNLVCTSVNKWDDEKIANEVFTSVKRNNQLTVTSIDFKEIIENPPLLFDLTGLQKLANTIFNFTADETLTIAQKLYENRFITYPRTSSKHIPEDIWTSIPNLIRNLKDKESCRSSVSNLKLNQLNKRIVDDLKITDHHGIIITEKIPTALSPKENALYDLIALRLIESVSEPCLKKLQSINFQSLHYDFFTKGCIINQAGWRAVKGVFDNDDVSIFQDLLVFNKGDCFAINQINLLEKKSRAPSLLTDAGILTLMENAGKNSDFEIKNFKTNNIGLGTSATRAAIIEVLLSRQYITRTNKFLIPTEKGLNVYQAIKNFKISSVEMTLEWESRLHQIEIGKGCDITFQKDIENYAIEITNELLANIETVNDNILLTCPKCKKEKVVLKERIAKCGADICGWKQFRMVCDFYLTDSQITKLITDGTTDLLSDFVSKNGKKFSARILLNTHGESSFTFS